MPVSVVTANKLINGEFKTFKELEDSMEEFIDFRNDINLLFREVDNVNRKGLTNYIIETIFINE